VMWWLVAMPTGPRQQVSLVFDASKVKHTFHASKLTHTLDASKVKHMCDASRYMFWGEQIIYCHSALF